MSAFTNVKPRWAATFHEIIDVNERTPPSRSAKVFGMAVGSLGS